MKAKLHSRWRKIKTKPQVTSIALLGLGLITLVVIIIMGYIFRWDWTGLGPYTSPHPYESNFQREKTLWDWMQLLIIPVVLAIAGYLFNLTTSRNEREITSDNQREAALQQYIDKMSELLLDRNLHDPQAKEVHKIAHLRTLTVLPRLDPKRKGSIIQFLYEADLITKSNSIIDLNDADLTGADLKGANLFAANLKGAKLHGAYLRDANLQDVDLRGADLSAASLVLANLNGADLSGTHENGTYGQYTKSTYLIATDLRFAALETANLSEANLLGANLYGAKLQYAELSMANLNKAILTSEQLESTSSLKLATMPDGSKHP